MYYTDLRERMCKELRDIETKDTFCPCDLDTASKLIGSINGIDVLSHAPASAHAEASVPHTMQEHLSMDEAKHWTAKMQNVDGTKGPHWTPDQTSSVMTQRDLVFDKADFYAAMNMMYSDYCMVAKSYSADNPNFYADMAAAFLRDRDAAAGKIVIYHDTIAGG